MRPVVLLCPLLLFACAPRAILLVDASQSPSRRTAPAQVSESAAVDSPSIDSGDDPIGLLEPKSLTRMPEERDMRPTVDPEADRPVIANPPTGE